MTLKTVYDAKQHIMPVISDGLTQTTLKRTMTFYDSTYIGLAT